MEHTPIHTAGRNIRWVRRLSSYSSLLKTNGHSGLLPYARHMPIVLRVLVCLTVSSKAVAQSSGYVTTRHDSCLPDLILYVHANSEQIFM